MINYPETAVVLVTTHGSIKVQQSTTLEDLSFHVPDNMSMTILNAVPPGVCNFLESKDTDDFAKNLIQKITEDAWMPIKGSEHAACYDVYATSLVKTGPGKMTVGLGFATEIPEGWKEDLSSLDNYCEQ
jgi:hypothetical protein